jgi:hypothetical protein
MPFQSSFGKVGIEHLTEPTHENYPTHDRRQPHDRFSHHQLPPQQPPVLHRRPEEPNHPPEYRHRNRSRRNLRPAQR